ncbi:hypothetical protein OIV83_005595 [Microbotryomycetes sp. JL201]|nr:hypothetical protein OIV83_005595 [Microbotryomycetes sp. JL201]
MQFSRAKRFTETTTSDVPPVGAYDVPVSMADPSYKRGAMLERADRFHQDRDNGAGEYLWDMEEYKQRIQAQHEKDLAKLQAKITKLELVREEAHSSKADTAREMASLKTEVRNLTSREQHLSSKLTKTEASLAKHQALLPKLQSQLELLSSSHTDSRKRKESEIVELRALVSARDAELQEAAEDAQLWQDRASIERRARTDAAKMAGDEIERLRILVNDIRMGELVGLKYKGARLERQLADRIAQVDALADYVAAVEQESEYFRQQLEMAEADRDWAMDMWRQEREDRVGEKEWRQRARSDQREMLGLRDEVKILETIRATERDIDATTRVSEAAKIELLERQRHMLERELEVAEGELDLATNDEIPRLESELETVKQDAAELRDRASELHEALEVAENDIKELQTRAAEELERHEGEMEEQRRRLADKDKEVERERAEKKRVAGLLGQSRASQDGLREELDAALAELATAQKLQSDNKELARTVDQLSRLQAATEQDNRLLADQNTDLISHGNPHQKIRHLAQIREELAESKRKHLLTTSDLASARSEIAALKAELEAYRSVSPLGASAMGPPTSIATRTRVARPMLDDVLHPRSGLPSFVVSGEHDAYRFTTSTGQLHPNPYGHGVALSLSADSAISARKAGRVTFDEDRRTTKGRVSMGAQRMEGPMTVSELIG